VGIGDGSPVSSVGTNGRAGSGVGGALKGPKALESLKDYQGAAFRFIKYVAPSEDWRKDHCAGCWATFAEYDGSDILHERYVTSVPYDETPDEFMT